MRGRSVKALVDSGYAGGDQFDLSEVQAVTSFWVDEIPQVEGQQEIEQIPHCVGYQGHRSYHVRDARTGNPIVEAGVALSYPVGWDHTNPGAIVTAFTGK